MKEPPLMVGLGEVLWDFLPSGKMLGGAPANFAYMTCAFGNRGIVASRIGDDELGRQLCEAMRTLGLSTSHLQQDGQYETGSAEVSIDFDRSADIHNQGIRRLGFFAMDIRLGAVIRAS